MEYFVLLRLIRANAARLVTEEEVVRLYYCVDNTREYREMGEQGCKSIATIGNQEQPLVFQTESPRVSPRLSKGIL